MATTRADIVARVRARVRAMQQTDIGSDALLLDNLINTETDAVAQRTQCLYRQMETDLTDGQAEYCIPELTNGLSIFDLRFVTITRTTGERVILRPVNDVELRQRIPEWITNPQEGEPFAYRYAAPSVFLYYTPDTTVSGGLEFSGYAVPGTSWSSSSSSFPLPEQGVEAVVSKVCAALLLPWLGDPKRATQVAQLHAAFDERGERAVADLHADMVRAYNQGGARTRRIA